MIRQAISCDICSSEKKQTNHWFVVSEQAGELRVSGWSSRNRLRPGSKHLCGQICLHKLVDDFTARTLAVRVPPAPADEAEEHVPVQAQVRVQTAGVDTSLTSNAAYEEIESSARLLTPYEEIESSARLLPGPVPAVPKQLPLRPKTELVALPARLEPRVQETAPPDEPPRFASRNWHAEAWDRERARELRGAQRRPDAAPRRRSGS